MMISENDGKTTVLMSALAMVPLLLSAAAVEGWECPVCGDEVSGQLCPACGVIMPPEGMVFVDAGTVVIEGDTLAFEPFFVDPEPVAYRSVLPWLNSTVGSIEEWAMIITGQLDEDMLFLKYTPFTSSSDGRSITVPASCFDIPAASFTWEGARHFLSDQGRMLPSRVQMYAIFDAGLVNAYDVRQVMSTYENVVVATIGDVLGALDRQAMFMPGMSTVEERIMWEWTRDAWSSAPGEAFDPDDATRAMFKPLDPPQLGFADRGNGYFNVVFRGVVPARLPGWER